jgi:hypothetical protein
MRNRRSTQETEEVECESHCENGCSGNARQHGMRRHGRHSPGSSLPVFYRALYGILRTFARQMRGFFLTTLPG